MKTLHLFAASLLLMGAQCFATDSAESILDAYAAAANQSDLQLRGASMNVDIVASVPGLEKTATLQGIRKISEAGAVTFASLQLSGDQAVRKEIIARYLVAEENENNAHDLSKLALTPANYRFQYRGVEPIEGHPAYCFRLRPRHKREGSFMGELWIDARAYLPLRENGRILQHSIFLRRLTLTRRFRIIDSRMALPESTSLDIDTRLVGKAQMVVKLHDVMFASSPAVNGAAEGNREVLPAVQ